MGAVDDQFACAATADGRIVHSACNRVFDKDGPHGEIFGSSLAPR